MWIVPLAMGALAMFVHKMVWEFDLWTRWGGLGYTPDGARAIVGAITSSMLTFIVFFLSILFLAVQLAATQLTPRVITDVFTRPVGKISLGIFVFTYLFSVALQGRSVDPVPQLALLLVIVFTVACLGVFLFLIGYMANSLRPISIVTRVAAEGAGAIEAIYSARLTGSEDSEIDDTFFRGAKPSATIPYRGKPGVFLAFDAQGLAEVARRNGCVIRLVPQVGRFVGEGDPLFHVYGGGETLRERELQQSVALGPERMIQQDPTFAFRIIVDIAIRALSPAVNDPTTAVQCIDQIHRLLPIVGRKDLGDGRIRSQEGHLRLVFPTPNWEDFVLLGVSEIRMYGASSMQVVRRLRAMLENLTELLPPRRHRFLHEQMILLDAALQRYFLDPEDRKAAGLADYAGIGGVVDPRSGTKNKN
jgi:uncharacterized membrane protein